MQEDQKGYTKKSCKNNKRVEQEHIITVVERAKQRKEEEEDTGTGLAGREIKGTKRETRQKKSKTTRT